MNGQSLDIWRENQSIAAFVEVLLRRGEVAQAQKHLSRGGALREALYSFFCVWFPFVVLGAVFSLPRPTLNRLAQLAEPTLLPGASVREMVHLHAYLLATADESFLGRTLNVKPWHEVQRTESSDSADAMVNEGQILDIFEGFVEGFDPEGSAHVTMKDRDGKMAHAEIDAKQLRLKGIGERDRFQCRIYECNGNSVLRISPLPGYQLSEADYRRIDKELDEAMPDSLLVDDDE